jgi:hypothetical protein
VSAWQDRFEQSLVRAKRESMRMGVLMLGAFVMHLKVRDPISKALPSLAVLAMCAAIALL